MPEILNGIDISDIDEAVAGLQEFFNRLLDLISGDMSRVQEALQNLLMEVMSAKAESQWKTARHRPRQSMHPVTVRPTPKVHNVSWYTTGFT